jgi:hypothetical protein
VTETNNANYLARIGAILALVLASPFCIFAQSQSASARNPVHCVTDISHDFSFYFDGRFGRNYVGDNGVDVRNWGTLHKYDLTNANLLILQSAGWPCQYTDADIRAVQRFLSQGGAVVVFGDFATFRHEKDYKLNVLAKHFGAEFLNENAKKPLQGLSILKNKKIESYSPKTIKLAPRSGWQVLVKDANDKPVLARRRISKGTLILSSRALCGRNPNASDPINQVWWKPLLQSASEKKIVDPKKRPHNQSPENKMQRDRLPIKCSDYLNPYAETIYDLYDRCFPVIEKVMGVPPSDGMLTTLILLPTNGGGFSSGSSIGLAVWWGNFPDKLYGMVELISHESTHSWVHPFTEPMWNEGIATYVGILVGKEMGLDADADATLQNWIRGAKRHDPDMTKCDIAHGKDIDHSVRMAKPMWIFEQLRKERPDILARYFQTKRKLATRDKIKQYTAHDSTAVLSIAMERDLFPWFQSLGITVEKAKVQTPFAAIPTRQFSQE